jgi:hypothetical protein
LVDGRIIDGAAVQRAIKRINNPDQMRVIIGHTSVHKLATELRNLKHPCYKPFLTGKETDDQLVDFWICFMAESVAIQHMIATGIEQPVSISDKKIDEALTESKDAKEFVSKIREFAEAEWDIQMRRAGIKSVKKWR